VLSTSDRRRLPTGETQWHRRLPAFLVLLSVVLLASLPVRAFAELRIGTALIPAGPLWDFSDSLLVFPPNGDLGWIIVLANDGDWSSKQFPEFWVTNSPAVIAFAPQDSTYEELTTAPSDSSQYSSIRALFDGGVYVVRTQEMHYAKLRVTCLACVPGGVLIEYAYQDDGSRILVSPVPVRRITWGQVKSLYKTR
jgi:hypothetical protein